MHDVISVAFDREEREVLARTTVWIGLMDAKAHLQEERSYASVLRHVSTREPNGHPRSILERAVRVTEAIRGVAQEDLGHWRPLYETAPQESVEGSLIARPQEAVGMIIHARQTAIADTGAALVLLRTAAARTIPTADMSEAV